MSKLDEILKEATIVELHPYSSEKVKSAIKHLFLELVGENHFEDGMAGDDKTATKYADYVLDSIREKVSKL